MKPSSAKLPAANATDAYPGALPYILGRLLLILTLFLLLNPILEVRSQNSLPNSIIGTWINQELTDNPLVHSLDSGKGERRNIDSLEFRIYTFKNNGNAVLEEFGTKHEAPFSLKDSTLTIGVRDYRIIKLSNDSLVLEIKSLFQNHRVFRRQEAISKIKKE